MGTPQRAYVRSPTRLDPLHRRLARRAMTGILWGAGLALLAFLLFSLYQFTNVP